MKDAVTVPAAGGGAAAGERREFRIDAPVSAADGSLGVLHQVVVHPGEGRVTGLVVRAATLPPRLLLIPLDAVRQARDDGIELSWSCGEARERGRFDEAAFHAPARGLVGYLAGQALVSLRRPVGSAERERERLRGALSLRPGLRVSALDGPAGRVREVLADSAGGGVTHLAVRQGGLFRPRDRLLPLEWVKEATPAGVRVEATLAELARLPEYRPDEELRDAILEKWRRDAALRAMLHQCRVHELVRDGRVTLQGYAWTGAHRRRLEELALMVPGVLDVRNEVIEDDSLAREVAAALGADPRTRAIQARVTSYLGHVRLAGDAPDTEVREAAVEVAARVPRVRAVACMMTVNGAEVPEPPQRLLSPRAGQRVLARDGRLGQVRAVVLSPRTRCVTAVVVDEEPAPARLGREESGGRPASGSRPLVIPEEWIEFVESEVVLRVTREEAGAGPRFRPEALIRPAADWLPPFPYSRQEVLLGEPERAQAAA